MWRSLVARVVRDDEVAGSNPVIPTNQEEGLPIGRPSFLCPASFVSDFRVRTVSGDSLPVPRTHRKGAPGHGSRVSRGSSAGNAYIGSGQFPMSGEDVIGSGQLPIAERLPFVFIGSGQFPIADVWTMGSGQLPIALTDSAAGAAAAKATAAASRAPAAIFFNIEILNKRRGLHQVSTTLLTHIVK
jgi:hypothetical protein